MNLLKFLLTNQLKRPRQSNKTGGFTLIELLVAVVLAFLVIAPLLGFMVNIMQTDRNEQAKANSEQEIQAALDYISRDLQQAVYIYDQDALTTPHAALPNRSGIKDQIPPDSGLIDGCRSGTSCVPVLAFWKLENMQEVVPINNRTDCLTASDSERQQNCNDAKAYSLVVYYHIKDNTCTAPWSCAARIGRFEIHDGVRDTQDNEIIPPDEGFAPFNLGEQGTLDAKMKAWEKAGEDYTNPMQILVDYIDKEEDATTGQSKGFAVNFTDTNPDVDIVDLVVDVSIRGNALARIRKGEPPEYNQSAAAYFPQSSVRLKGLGLLNNTK
ncbi:MAG TPA: hormogonium polysaccharide secretion pseudopilin HpsC [Leptolyngbyaceae cyanobacterium]